MPEQSPLLKATQPHLRLSIRAVLGSAGRSLMAGSTLLGATSALSPKSLLGAGWRELAGDETPRLAPVIPTGKPSQVWFSEAAAENLVLLGVAAGIEAADMALGLRPPPEEEGSPPAPLSLLTAGRPRARTLPLAPPAPVLLDTTTATPSSDGGRPGTPTTPPPTSRPRASTSPGPTGPSGPPTRAPLEPPAPGPLLGAPSPTGKPPPLDAPRPPTPSPTTGPSQTTPRVRSVSAPAPAPSTEATPRPTAPTTGAPTKPSPTSPPSPTSAPSPTRPLPPETMQTGERPTPPTSPPTSGTTTSRPPPPSATPRPSFGRRLLASASALSTTALVATAPTLTRMSFLGSGLSKQARARRQQEIVESTQRLDQLAEQPSDVFVPDTESVRESLFASRRQRLRFALFKARILLDMPTRTVGMTEADQVTRRRGLFAALRQRLTQLGEEAGLTGPKPGAAPKPLGQDLQLLSDTPPTKVDPSLLGDSLRDAVARIDHETPPPPRPSPTVTPDSPPVVGSTSGTPVTPPPPTKAVQGPTPSPTPPSTPSPGRGRSQSSPVMTGTSSMTDTSLMTGASLLAPLSVTLPGGPGGSTTPTTGLLTKAGPPTPTTLTARTDKTLLTDTTTSSTGKGTKDGTSTDTASTGPKEAGSLVARWRDPVLREKEFSFDKLKTDTVLRSELISQLEAADLTRQEEVEFEALQQKLSGVDRARRMELLTQRARARGVLLTARERNEINRLTRAIAYSDQGRVETESGRIGLSAAVLRNRELITLQNEGLDEAKRADRLKQARKLADAAVKGWVWSPDMPTAPVLGELMTRFENALHIQELRAKPTPTSRDLAIIRRLEYDERIAMNLQGTVPELDRAFGRVSRPGTTSPTPSLQESTLLTKDGPTPPLEGSGESSPGTGGPRARRMTTGDIRGKVGSVQSGLQTPVGVGTVLGGLSPGGEQVLRQGEAVTGRLLDVADQVLLTTERTRTARRNSTGSIPTPPRPKPPMTKGTHPSLLPQEAPKKTEVPRRPSPPVTERPPPPPLTPSPAAALAQLAEAEVKELLEQMLEQTGDGQRVLRRALELVEERQRLQRMRGL